MASKSKNSSKLKSLNWILWLAIGLLLISVILYFVFIFGLEDNEKANWGTFGDLIGGTLNPIFALFSLFAIIYTIKIQTEELELSREELKETKEELKESRIAQQEQSISLQLQNEATKLQMFENTFFKLVELFLETRETVSIELKLSKKALRASGGIDESRLYVNINGKDMQMMTFRIEKDEILKSSLAISKYLAILKDILGYYENNHYDTFNSYFEVNTRTYFSQIYQILKFIRDKEEENNIDAKRYSNILRAQFTVEELEFLFYHCLGSIGKEKFQELVERYQFFEHLKLNKYVNKQLLEYDINAFGKNETIIEKYKELEKV